MPLGKRWGVEQAIVWEDALRGSSALIAGLHRATMDELVGAYGGQRMALCLDLTKFFNSLRPRQLVLAILQHNAPPCGPVRRKLQCPGGWIRARGTARMRAGNELRQDLHLRRA